MPILATIGYEAASLVDFIATLQAARVHTLVDVRDLPISRRPGFAKKALAVALPSPITPRVFTGSSTAKARQIAS
jgi:hypothetical protein